jgi:hypothetical protein
MDFTNITTHTDLHTPKPSTQKINVDNDVKHWFRNV